MRFFKRRTNINWKYIIGEILLIFVGINLAIWFNNWNASNKINRNKQVAISKIKGEIQNNARELTKAQEINQSVLEAFTEYGKIYQENSSDLITTPDHLHDLQEKYPGFFRVEDTVDVGNGHFHYKGQTYISLELAELTEIAWETARTIGIINEFNYDCLYELESMYSLQRRIQREIDKAGNALQKREIKELMNILEFMKQLALQLTKDYEEVLENLDHCQ